MTHKPVRIGIIGVGQIGKQHLERYSKIPGAQVVAACDIDAPELARVAERFHIERTYADFRQLLQQSDIEAVDVCLHNNFHAPATIATLEAGKHAYCEKPMAGAYVDAVAMLDAAKRCGKKLSIQLSTLFDKEAKVAKHLIDAGRLGRIYHARSVGFRRRGRPFVDGYGTMNFVKKEIASGGALYDMGVYHISQLLYLMGQPRVLRISGKTYQEMDMDAERRKASGFNVEEMGLGLVRMADGVTLDIIEAWSIHLHATEGSCILGSQGGVRLSPFGYFTTAGDVDLDAGIDLGSADGRWHRLAADPDTHDSPQHHWIAALQGRTELLPTAEIALQTMLISEGVYLSNRLGREVSAEEVLSESKSTAVKL